MKFFCIWTIIFVLNTAVLTKGADETCDSENLRVCPNLCPTLVCNTAPRAQCVMNNCGRCEAEFYLNKRKILCDSVSTRFDIVDPIDSPFMPAATNEIDSPAVNQPQPGRKGEVQQCPEGVRRLNCVFNPCDRATCPRYPNAVCKLNNCGKCAAEFYTANNEKVDCRRRDNVGLCPKPNCNNQCPMGRVRDPNNCETCICKKARF